MDMIAASKTTAMPLSTINVSTPTAASTASGVSMLGMDMSASGDCKSSMFWNWYTLDACFVSKTWHITSHTMFAASCFAVVGLVLLLEFLHRLQREYDRHLLHRLQQRGTIDVEKGSTCGVPMPEGNRNARSSCEDPPSSARPLLGDWERSLPLGGQPCGPSAFQQAIRSGMYMLQFVVAYVIMLLAMYYNGYILLCILIGTFIGPFIFSRDALGAASMSSAENAACCA